MIRDVRHNIFRRAEEAKETETWLVEKLLREQDTGTDLLEFSAELQQIPTKRLVDYLSWLIELGDLAHIRCVRMAFAERPDRQKYAITVDKMLAKLAGRQSRELSELLSKIYRSVEQMDTRIANLLCANRSASPASTADSACPSQRRTTPEGVPSVLARGRAPLSSSALSQKPLT